MADALSAVPAAVLRNLSDKLYEKRKNAALEVEGIVKQLTAVGDHDKITAVINLLTHEFAYSPQANHRKGGLIGLAAAAVGLSTEAAQHLEVLSALNDIFDTLLKALSDSSDKVVLLVLEVHACIAKDQHNFSQLLVFLVHKFQADDALLEK
ncbi:putative vacuole morphology and inheritance protein [Helianthus debilis subsp. tardiflorus]